jgi:hypothetical protein
MNVALQEKCEKPILVAPEDQSPSWIFVSSTLATWKTATPDRFVRDFQINDTVYRRLDPEYYAWLRSRMVLAKKAATTGHLDAGAFEDLRTRFNAVHDWAIEHFREDQLLAAMQGSHAEYSPPGATDEIGHARSLRGRKSAANDSLPEAIALVDAIAEQALAIGWNWEALYGTGVNGIFDPRRGLVCYLEPHDRIGEVTVQSIEIIHPLPSEVRHRFYNPDADQPWIRHVR